MLIAHQLWISVAWRRPFADALGHANCARAMWARNKMVTAIAVPTGMYQSVATAAMTNRRHAGCGNES
jgi:hypothetical protein